tara:strand:- start:2039 stop:2797 length:759 start_codon:yes stop_codon:yes gene_type:complete
MKSTLGVIPARMASARFPGKPLKKILNVPMLGHCYERALLSGACDKLIIASPDKEILDWAQAHNIHSVLTSHNHQRASDRATEAMNKLAQDGEAYDLILLLQGDEPQILPDDIQRLKAAFHGNDCEVVNLVFPIAEDDFKNLNIVKAIVDNSLNIKFFSRSHIPFNSISTFRQLGMIGFTKKALQQYSSILPSSLEEIESIDMMRLLENDLPIKGVLSSSSILGVDNPEDIKKVETMMADDKLIGIYKEKYI